MFFRMLICTRNTRNMKWVDINDMTDIHHDVLDTISKALVGVGPCEDEVTGVMIWGETDDDIDEVAHVVGYYMSTRLDWLYKLDYYTEKINFIKSASYVPFVDTVKNAIWEIWHETLKGAFEDV